MLRRFSYTFVMCCFVAMTAYFAVRSNEAADPQPAQTPGKEDAAGQTKTPEAPADPFAVPEGTDDQALMLFLQRIVRTPPEDPNPEAIVVHLHKIDKAIGEILSRNISDELFQSVAELRLQIYAALPQFGDKTVEEKKKAFVKSLEESKRPGVQKMVKRLEFQERVQQLSMMDQKQQQELIDDVTKLIESTPKGDDEDLQTGVQMAMSIGQTLEQMNSSLTVPTYRKFIKAIESKKDERLADLVKSMQGTARRLELPGQKIEVAGKTLAGKDFKIEDYKGKVVLVDFWATWCGPCMAEFPHLQEVYQGFHKKGLEIVGISLDNDKAELEKFIQEKDVKWVTLFEEGEGSGWTNSIASHYGISGIPTMILVNRDGKVVTVRVGGFGDNSQGTSLEQELEKLLGPPEKVADEQKPDDKQSPTK